MDSISKTPRIEALKCATFHLEAGKVKGMNKIPLLVRYRTVLCGFLVGLVLSGATAFPLTTEIRWLAGVLQGAPLQLPALNAWIFRVRNALVLTDGRFPFLAYGTDWLAFAHLMIAVAFIGPLRDPVRNRWVLEWAMICCVGVLPLAFIMGPVRGIPFGWTLVDCAFDVAGFPPLWGCWRWSKAIESQNQDTLRCASAIKMYNT